MLIEQWFISHLVLFLSDTVGAVWKSSNKICSHWLSSWQGAAGILPLTGNWHFDSVSASRFIRWANPAGTMSGIDGRRQVVIDTGANRTSCWPLWLPVRLFKNGSLIRYSVGLSVCCWNGSYSSKERVGNRDKTRKRRGNKERIWIARRRAKKEKEILEKKKRFYQNRKKKDYQ